MNEKRKNTSNINFQNKQRKVEINWHETLYQAILDNNAEEVLNALKNKANSNYIVDEVVQKSMLQVACSRREGANLAIIKHLIDYKADVNYVDQYQKSCLFYIFLPRKNDQMPVNKKKALLEHAKKVIELLLKAGVDPNLTARNGYSFIFDVCELIGTHLSNQELYLRSLDIYKLPLQSGADVTIPVDKPWYCTENAPQHSPELNKLDFILYSLLHRRADHKNFIDNTAFFKLINMDINKFLDEKIPSGKLLKFIYNGNDEQEKENRRVFVKDKLFSEMLHKIYASPNSDLFSQTERRSAIGFFMACKRIKVKLPTPIKKHLIDLTRTFKVDFMKKDTLTIELADHTINSMYALVHFEKKPEISAIQNQDKKQFIFYKEEVWLFDGKKLTVNDKLSQLTMVKKSEIGLCQALNFVQNAAATKHDLNIISEYTGLKFDKVQPPKDVSNNSVGTLNIGMARN